MAMVSAAPSSTSAFMNPVKTSVTNNPPNARVRPPGAAATRTKVSASTITVSTSTSRVDCAR
jgi:hypothetical protein